MRIPLFVGEGKIKFGEKDIPVAGPGQLLIEVKANALCGSERGQFNSGTRITPGHEAAGVVAAVGPGTNTAVGTSGVVFLMDYCGQCRNCQHGFTNQCLVKRADYGFSHDGGYGPFMLVNENVFFAVDRDIPLPEATMLLDIMGTGGHALQRAKRVHSDIRTVLVTGAGPIGLGVLAMAKLVLGMDTPVFITDFVEYRLELARQMGAITINLASTKVEESIKREGIDKLDIAIDTSGKTAGRHSALEVLGSRGVLVCVGHGEQLNLQVSSDLIEKERTVLGSEYFQYNEIGANHELLKQHLPYLSQIITHRFGVEQIQEAFELFFKGETGKVIIEQ